MARKAPENASKEARKSENGRHCQKIRNVWCGAKKTFSDRAIEQIKIELICASLAQLIQIPNKNSNNMLLILRGMYGQTRHRYCVFG